MRRSRLIAGVLGLAAVVMLLGLQAMPLAVHDGESEVTVGSNDNIFSQNKQNEPAVAMTPPIHGWSPQARTTTSIWKPATPAPITPVRSRRTSAVEHPVLLQLRRHVDPAHLHGAHRTRDCLGVVGDSDPPCVAHPGPMERCLTTTTPGWSPMAILRWSSDRARVPAGSSRGPTDRVCTTRTSRPLPRFTRWLRSRASRRSPSRGWMFLRASTRFPKRGALVASEDSWAPPVVVSKQSATTFSDKEQIWADQNQDSPFFGNAYVCWASFRSLSGGNAAPTPLVVGVSSDGGDTWRTKQVTDATNNPFNPKKGFGRSGCTIARTAMASST